MNLIHAYGTPPPEDVARAVLLGALDEGITFFDTAALYGFGANEELLARVLGPHRDQVVLATKGGMFRDEAGKRFIDGRPETLRRHCEDSLRRLRTDVIDLYYLHRWDKKIPVEDSIGALAELVREGKIRAIGLSEVSATTLRRAHRVHPVAALQSEYSLWTRNPEIAALAACRELGVSLIAFSPLARGFLTGRLRNPEAQLEPKDIRRAMPRFSREHYPTNLALLDEYEAVAAEAGCTPAQLALAWLLARDPALVPIPGTRQPAFMVENARSAGVRLGPSTVAALDRLVNQRTVAGARYNEATQLEIDTEEFWSTLAP